MTNDIDEMERVRWNGGLGMESVFAINLPQDQWWHIGQAPKDGRLIFIRDGFGHVDLAKWSNEEWTAEFGVCDEPTQFQYISIVDARDA